MAGSVVTKKTTASIRPENIVAVAGRFALVCEEVPRSHVIEALGVLKAECGTSTELLGLRRLQHIAEPQEDQVGNVFTASSNPLRASMFISGFLVDGS